MDGTLSGGRYDALCREITAEMSARSLEAIAVEDALLAAGKEAPAASIRVVQMGEKAKLNLTCTLQVLRKSAAEGRWRWQRGDDDEEEAVAAAAAAHAAAPIPDAPADISRPGFANGNFRRKCATHSFGCGCLAAGGSAPPEPTEAEYAARRGGGDANARGGGGGDKRGAAGAQRGTRGARGGRVIGVGRSERSRRRPRRVGVRAAPGGWVQIVPRRRRGARGERIPQRLLYKRLCLICASTPPNPTCNQRSYGKRRRLLHLALGTALLEGLLRLLALGLGLALEDGEGEVGDGVLRLLEAEEVRPRTTLMIAMRLEESTSVMTRSNSVFSAASSAPPAAGPAAITMPPAGAEASTPKVSSIWATSSEASRSCGREREERRSDRWVSVRVRWIVPVAEWAESGGARGEPSARVRGSPPRGRIASGFEGWGFSPTSVVAEGTRRRTRRGARVEGGSAAENAGLPRG